MKLSEREKFGVVKEITRALKKQFPGMSSYSYGYCCGSDYDAYHEHVNNQDDVSAKIYKGGANNQYDRDGWHIGSAVYWTWTLTMFPFEEVIRVMSEVVGERGTVIAPRNEDGTPDDSRCIKVVFGGEQDE